MLTAFKAFLVAVPYGKIADRYGKSKVIAASLVGLILARSWTIVVRKSSVLKSNSF